MSETGSYARLMAWAGQNRVTPDVNKTTNAHGGVQWSIGFSIASPVKFHVYAYSSTVEEAAEEVIADLATVGVAVA